MKCTVTSDHLIFSLILQSGQYHFVRRPGGSCKPTHSRWNHSRSHCEGESQSVHALTMRQKSRTYSLIFTTNHRAKAHISTKTIPRLIRIDFLTGSLFVKLRVFFLFLYTALRCFLGRIRRSSCTSFPRRVLSPANTDSCPAILGAHDRAWSGAFAASAGGCRGG